MPDYQPAKYVVLACHLTGIYDVNRSEVLPDDDFGLVRDWALSLEKLNIRGIIFHNNFSEATCQAHQSDFLSFEKIEYDRRFKPNVFRYLVYRDYLRVQAHRLESLFVTDVSDVVAVNNPFTDPFFLSRPEALFCGDEPKPLHNDWMRKHAAHLRGKIADYAAYESRFAESTLLNCGIFGGNIGVMHGFIRELATLHEAHNHDNQTAYTGDMGAFNYLARTAYNDRLVHGAPVNTIFKAYENERVDCWFRHK